MGISCWSCLNIYFPPKQAPRECPSLRDIKKGGKVVVENRKLIYLITEAVDAR